jgi:hypothetical protein
MEESLAAELLAGARRLNIDDLISGTRYVIMEKDPDQRPTTFEGTFLEAYKEYFPQTVFNNMMKIGRPYLIYVPTARQTFREKDWYFYPTVETIQNKQALRLATKSMNKLPAEVTGKIYEFLGPNRVVPRSTRKRSRRNRRRSTRHR